jgi:uncharacterized protein (DUF885 family)
MKALIMWLGVAAFAAAPLAARAADKDFVTVANAYVEDMLKANPETATQLGDHRYDAQLTDRSAGAIAAQTQMNKDYLAKLAAIDPKSLNQTNQIDYEILKSNLERGVFEAEELKEQEWNPIYYNMGSAIFSLVARDFAPLDQRLESLKGRLEQIPNVVAAAKANLKNPPEMHTRTAMQQNEGNIALIRDDLTQFVSKSPTMEKELAPIRAAAVTALEEYGLWLQKDLLPRSTGDFRLGDALWRKKLRFSLDSDLSKEEIYARAETDLKATQQTMYATALPLFKAYFPEEKDAAKLADVKYVNKAVLDHIAQGHPTNADIVDKAKTALAEATQFVRDKKLVTVPKEPVKVIVMPEFQRGVAVAYCESPGPLEPHADTFFSIAPTPKDWTPERTESFFKEYNDKMLYNLTVHEAMPGHYLQGAHSNQFKAPTLVRAIFSSGLFAEGWAVYTEKMMADAGFGGPEVHMQQLKMRLRVIINAIIDQKIHTENMSEKDAMALMMNEGYQEDGEAAGKWRRACLTSTQLSTYYVGSAEVEGIKAAWETRNKPNLLKMNDQITSFGTPSPKYIKRSMGL